MLNNISLMGRMVKDPEIRYTKEQKPVANFTLAVDRDRIDGTDFIDCVAWNSQAEFLNKYFHKGSMTVVTGRLQMRKYEAKDGTNRTAYEIVATNIYFGESKRENM